MAIPKSEFIWFDGEFVPWDEAKVHVLSHVLHYGTSVFEGIRAYQTPAGPAILGLQAHVRRLFNSSKIINMPVPFSQEEINQAIIDTVARNEHNEQPSHIHRKNAFWTTMLPKAFTGIGQVIPIPSGVAPIDNCVGSRISPSHTISDGYSIRYSIAAIHMSKLHATTYSVPTTVPGGSFGQFAVYCMSG